MVVGEKEVSFGVEKALLIEAHVHIPSLQEADQVLDQFERLLGVRGPIEVAAHRSRKVLGTWTQP